MRFAESTGRRVVSRADAEEVGTVRSFVVDAAARRVEAVVVGRRRHPDVIAWADLTGFGPDAVMVADADRLRSPATDREEAAAAGKLDLLGKRVLTDEGFHAGDLADVDFDPATGALLSLVVGAETVAAERLLGAGSYAVVIAADPAR